MFTSLKDQILKVARTEIENPIIPSAEQLLAVMEVEVDANNLAIVKHFEINQENQEAIVFFQLKEFCFYLEIHLDLTDEIEVVFANTTPYINISLSFLSEEYSLDQLIEKTILQPSEIIKIGDITYLYDNIDDKSDYNNIIFTGSEKPGHFEEKLIEFINFLEQDKAGIKELVQMTGDQTLFIIFVYHISNGNLSDLQLSSNVIKRLAELDLQVTFDLYTEGERI
jgi:hypothetical protein